VSLDDGPGNQDDILLHRCNLSPDNNLPCHRFSLGTRAPKTNRARVGHSSAEQ
jgi:hypothetical protein